MDSSGEVCRGTDVSRGAQQEDLSYVDEEMDGREKRKYVSN